MRWASPLLALFIGTVSKHMRWFKLFIYCYKQFLLLTFLLPLRDCKTLPLYIQQKNKTKRQKSSGCLKILQCYVDRQYSVLDFVRGGCNMQFVCAFDFTFSNGDPKETNSLHSIVSEHVCLILPTFLFRVNGREALFLVINIIISTDTTDIFFSICLWPKPYLT